MKQWALLSLAVLAGSSPGWAQDDSRLVAAVRLAQDGGGDSARALIAEMISATRETDPLYPEIVYTMGLVARDANDRSRNFRRVAVEFAGSAWADDALLGLAQEDFGAGRADASVRGLERIRADYPSSPLLPTVWFWGARAYFEMRNTAEACRWLAQGLAQSGNDVELQNQLNFYAPRCSAESAAATQPAAPSPGISPGAAPPLAAGGRFAVQVVAAGTEAAAEATANQLRTAGYEPYIVREGGFIKVRVGRFGTRADAAAAASQIRARLGGGPFVVEQP